MELELVFSEKKLYLRHVPAFVATAKHVEGLNALLAFARDHGEEVTVNGHDVTVMTTIDMSWIVPDSLWDFGEELGVGEYAEQMVKMYVNEFMQARGKEILSMIDKARSEVIAEHLAKEATE